MDKTVSDVKNLYFNNNLHSLEAIRKLREHGMAFVDARNLVSAWGLVKKKIATAETPKIK